MISNHKKKFNQIANLIFPISGFVLFLKKLPLNNFLYIKKIFRLNGVFIGLKSELLKTPFIFQFFPPDKIVRIPKFGIMFYSKITDFNTLSLPFLTLFLFKF